MAPTRWNWNESERECINAHRKKEDKKEKSLVLKNKTKQNKSWCSLTSTRIEDGAPQPAGP